MFVLLELNEIITSLAGNKSSLTLFPGSYVQNHVANGTDRAPYSAKSPTILGGCFTEDLDLSQQFAIIH